MIRINDIYMPLVFTENDLLRRAAGEIKIKPSDIKDMKLVRKSVDARRRSDVHFTVSVELETANEREILRRFPASKVSAVTREPYYVHFSGLRSRGYVRCPHFSEERSEACGHRAGRRLR